MLLKIDTLPTHYRLLAQKEYDQRKYSKWNWYLCRWFWFYRLYTEQYLLFILFLISLLFGIGIIRWIIDAFMVSSYVEKKNHELDEELEIKYRK